MRRHLEPADGEVDPELHSSRGEGGEGEGHQRPRAFDQPTVRRLRRDDEGGQDCGADWEQSCPVAVLLRSSRDVPLPSEEGEHVLNF